MMRFFSLFTRIRNLNAIYSLETELVDFFSRYQDNGNREISVIKINNNPIISGITIEGNKDNNESFHFL